MRKKYFLLISLVVFGLSTVSTTTRAQSSYHDYDALTNQLRALASQYGNLTNIQSLATSPGGHDLWLLTIGTGDTSTKPAVAVAGGIEGTHMLGSELALRFAEDLLSRSRTDSIQTLLESTTFYIMPRVNPDALEAYFASPQYERGGNATATDDDRDGRTNEDGPEDLSGDRLLTMMRVADATGEYVVHAKDSRLMTTATNQPATAERYRMLSEGRNNDQDEAFNEDSAGGVNINRNFTFDYPAFQPGAGENMASQPETRAVMDFLYEKGWNVFAVVSFGPENNLSSPTTYNAGAASQRVVSSWLEEDVAVNKMVSEIYNNVTSLEKAPDGPPRQGDFFQWAYYHYGRLSFSTPGWWTPTLLDANGNPASFDNPDAHYLAWADSQGVDAFVDWQEINHPDFPDQTVEVGGIKPFVRNTPPYAAVDSLASQHTDFLVRLAQMRPRIEIVNVKSESVGSGLTRITADIHNAGQLPTASKLGERTRWARDVQLEMNLSDDLHIVSGLPYQSFPSLGGNESETVTWLVRGNGSYTIRAGAPAAGFTTIEKSTN